MHTKTRSSKKLVGSAITVLVGLVLYGIAAWQLIVAIMGYAGHCEKDRPVAIMTTLTFVQEVFPLFLWSLVFARWIANVQLSTFLRFITYGHVALLLVETVVLWSLAGATTNFSCLYDSRLLFWMIGSCVLAFLGILASTMMILYYGSLGIMSIITVNVTEA